MKKNSFETLIYSVVGIVIFLVIVIAVNVVAGRFKERVDLTKEKTYTLSAGTKSILANLTNKVTIRYYYSSSEGDSGETILLKSYAQHVADLLDEYKQAGKGKVVVEQFDPKPDSDAEDSARLDGVEGQLLPNGEKFYMGISISMLENKEAIPFLDPSREKLLEYDLSRSITRVEQPEKPVVGIMTPLPMFGQAANPMMAMRGQQQEGQEPWVFVSELNADFNVKRVPMTVSNIDDSIKVLVVVDPKNITDSAQFAIDQFLMRGGKLIAFLDSTSLVDKQSDNPMMSQMPGSGSSLDKLLKAWGIDFDPTKTVADRKYKVKLGGANNQPIEAPAFLALDADAINHDDIATSEIHDIWYPMGGAFTGKPVAGLSETVLLKSSKDAELTDGMMASFSGDKILSDFKPTGIEYPLAIRLTGNFKSAFPNGEPQAPGETNVAAVAKSSLKETKQPGVVVLFGDADLLFDQFALRQRQTMLGPMGYEAANGNLILAQNLVDQLAGDSNLIRIRSRAVTDRPFTRIKALEAKAQESFQSKIKEYEASLQETQERVNELQRNKAQGAQKFILSPEQQAELEKLKRKQAEVNVQLKAERKKLTQNINSLKNNLKWTNIVAMPALVAISGIGLALVKRKRTSAK